MPIYLHLQFPPSLYSRRKGEFLAYYFHFFIRKLFSLTDNSRKSLPNSSANSFDAAIAYAQCRRFDHLCFLACDKALPATDLEVLL